VSTQYTANVSWSGPRWAKVERFVDNLAFQLNLECRTNVDKGLLTEYGQARVKGSEENCNDFVRIFYESLETYNH
jgi:hypothetical protein